MKVYNFFIKTEFILRQRQISIIDCVKFENSYIFLMLQVFIFIVDVFIGNTNVKNAGRGDKK